MATISSAGVGSGLDVETIITKLMAIERQPVTQLQSKASKIQAQISSWGKLQSALSALGDASDKLAAASTWNARSAASGDATALNATVTGNGATGRVAIRPTQLAASQSNASAGFAAKTDSVGTGSLTIELGTWTGESAFAPKAGANAITIDIGTGSDSLEKVRDKINAADAGVSASIVNDGSAYRLVFTSTDPGAANGFRITSADDDGNATDAVGLSRLAYDPPSGATGMTRNVASADAIALVNNLEIHSSSNTFNDALEGVSFSISKTSTTDVTLDLTADKTGMKKVMDDFVTAYNALNTLMRENTKINTADTTKGGTLQGDRTASSLQNSMRALLRQAGPASSTFAHLSDVGFEVKLDGSLTLNDTKAQAALAKPDQLRKLLAGDPDNSTVKGVGKQIGDALDTLLRVDGNVKNRTNGLQDTLKRNQDQQSRVEDRLTMVEKRLRAQYTALDASMASLNSLSSYVSQQVTTWNKSTG